MDLDRITVFCFAASYAVALAMEVLHLLRPAVIGRLVAHVTAGAGLFAHTLYLISHGRPLAVLFLSWILAVFYLYGSLHHRRVAWGVFVLPVVLGLVLLAWLSPYVTEPANLTAWTEAEQVWVVLHFTLLMLGSVGVCVGFVASVMYLVQAWRLRHKKLAGEGLRLLSLERLEAMNRRAINLAFPLFTAGLLIGAWLWQSIDLPWTDPKVLSAGAFWVVSLVLLYLRYGLHLHGRRLAVGTVAAFALLILVMVIHFLAETAHPSGGAL